MLHPTPAFQCKFDLTNTQLQWDVHFFDQFWFQASIGNLAMSHLVAFHGIHDRSVICGGTRVHRGIGRNVAHPCSNWLRRGRSA